MRPVQTVPWHLPLAPLQTHTDETKDLLVCSELLRLIPGPGAALDTLKVNIVANPSPVRPGEQVNYVMTVVNQGVTDLSGVELRQLMPAYMVDIYSSGGTWESVSGNNYYLDSGDIVTWNLGTLPAGQSRSVVFSAEVTSGSGAPTNGTQIATTAMALAANGASSAASASVIAHANPALRLSMTGDRSPVQAGDVLTYTLDYGNPGAVSLSGVGLRAVVPAGTTFLSANEGGVLTNNEVIWDLGTVSVGASGQRTLRVSVNAGLNNGATIAGHAEIGGGEGRADTLTVVQTSPVLALTMTASPDPVRPGEQINYVMTVVNRGAADLSAVRVRQLMPPYMVDIYYSGGTWESVSGNNYYLDSGDIVTWNLGTLPAGQSRSVVFAATVNTGSYAPPNNALITSSAEVSHAGGSGVSASASVIVGWPHPVVWEIGSGGNGHRYQVVPGGMTWGEANAAAQTAGGYLATITSAAENDFVFSLIDRASMWSSSGTSRFGPWIGGVQSPGSPEPAGGWGWITGEAFGYSNWYPGEPNNGNGNQDRIYFLTASPLERGATWGDKSASDTLPGCVIEFAQVVIQRPTFSQARMRSDGSVDLDLMGETGVRYRVQASTNLVDWIDIGTVTPNGGPAASFRDLGATNLTLRFYRLVTP